MLLIVLPYIYTKAPTVTFRQTMLHIGDGIILLQAIKNPLEAGLCITKYRYLRSC